MCSYQKVKIEQGHANTLILCHEKKVECGRQESVGHTVILFSPSRSGAACSIAKQGNRLLIS